MEPLVLLLVLFLAAVVEVVRCTEITLGTEVLEVEVIFNQQEVKVLLDKETMVEMVLNILLLAGTLVVVVVELVLLGWLLMFVEQIRLVVEEQENILETNLATILENLAGFLVAEEEDAKQELKMADLLDLEEGVMVEVTDLTALELLVKTATLIVEEEEERAMREAKYLEKLATVALV